MGGPEEKDHATSKNDGEMNRSRPPGAMQQRILEGIVHVELRREKPGKDQQRGSDRRLQRQGARIIAEKPHGPQQDEGQNEVECGEQPYPKRVMGIPHVFRSTDEMMSRNEPPGDVQSPENSDD